MFTKHPKEWDLSDAIAEGCKATASDVIMLLTMMTCDPETADALLAPITDDREGGTFEAFIWAAEEKDEHDDLPTFDSDELPY